jgi:hypothetical protein
MMRRKRVESSKFWSIGRAGGNNANCEPLQMISGLAVSDYSQKVLRIEENGIVGLKILKI